MMIPNYFLRERRSKTKRKAKLKEKEKERRNGFVSPFTRFPLFFVSFRVRQFES